MRIWIALLSLLLVGFTGTGVTITGGKVNVVAAPSVTCVEDIALDDFTSGTIGTDWTTSGVDTDQTNCPWSIDTGGGDLRWDSDHTTLCDNRTFSILNDTTLSGAHQWACMTMTQNSGGSRFGLLVRADTSDESTLLTHLYFAPGNTDHRHRENEAASEVCSGIDIGGSVDELCIEIVGTGTEEVVNFWKNPVAGDPDDWGAPDCSITDMVGTNDSGGFIGIHIRSSDVSETANIRMDDFRAGTCSPS